MNIISIGGEGIVAQGGDYLAMIDGRITVQASGKDEALVVALLESMDFNMLKEFGQ